MSLMRLLSAGKSLLGGKDAPTRYRMREPGMLPKFGGKNPFLKSDKKADGLPHTGLIAPAGEAMRGSETTHEAEVGEAEQKGSGGRVRASTVEPGPAREWKANTEKSQGKAAWKGWLGQVRAKAWPRKKVEKSHQVDAGPKRRELSLDKVRVLCNDLSDADVELVPALGAERKAGADLMAAPRVPAVAEQENFVLKTAAKEGCGLRDA
jgi:hypothetical protein